MKITREAVIDTAIKMFSKDGIQNVSLTMIADTLGVTRQSVCHYFKKDDLVDCILEIFGNIIDRNMPTFTEDMEIDAEIVLSNLFLSFSDEDAEQSRKINRIVFTNYGSDPKIGKYLSEMFYHKHEARFARLLNLLIIKGKVKPFDVDCAARIMNRIFISYALEDSFNYPFGDGSYEKFIDRIKNDCSKIIDSILSGCFQA
jgi:AcrR family transcriptional regulator